MKKHEKHASAKRVKKSFKMRHKKSKLRQFIERSVAL